MQKRNEKKIEEQNTLVVGLGASAGGLEALQEFFRSMPEETGMAFIVVFHLSPDRDSNFTEILQRETSLDVEQVHGKTEIERDHIYVIPPNELLSVEDNHLELSDPEQEHCFASIDLFFRTLARKKQKFSAGIIFSGSGNDGVTGMKIIKEEGGTTLAQAPEEAKYSSKPNSVIQSGAIDKVLSVKDMLKELLEYRETLSKLRIAEEAGELSKEEKTYAQI